MSSGFQKYFVQNIKHKTNRSWFSNEDHSQGVSLNIPCYAKPAYLTWGGSDEDETISCMARGGPGNHRGKINQVNIIES